MMLTKVLSERISASLMSGFGNRQLVVGRHHGFECRIDVLGVVALREVAAGDGVERLRSPATRRPQFQILRPGVAASMG